MPIVPIGGSSAAANPVATGPTKTVLPVSTVAPTICYRRIDANGEPQFGQGRADFVTDIEAVAQAIRTRLLLFTGEWWEDGEDGTPYWQSILGVAAAGKNPQAVNLLLIQRIQGTPYVTGVRNVQSQYSPTTRAYQFSCVVDTEFGALVVTNIPSVHPAQSQGYGEGGYGLGIYPA